jgi:hypothetical protein
MTVSKLISLLSELDPNEGIVFQYLTAEHAGYDEPSFRDIASALLEDEDFASESAFFLQRWIEDAADEIK